MNKRTSFVLFVLVLSVLTACKPDAPLMYDSPDGIYFNAPKDSISYTFAKYPSRLVDTIKVPIAVLGMPAAQDRELAVVSLSGGDVNAVEGTHYKLLKPYIIPANSVATNISVVVNRTQDMDNGAATFQLQLKENANFEMGITSKTSMKIKVGYLEKPQTWGDFNGLQWAGYKDNFGTWTKTKYKLILDALYDPVSDTTVSEFPIGSRSSYPTSYPQYLQIVRNYIRTKYPGNYTGVGATLTDPDIPNNSVIRVGPANY